MTAGKALFSVFGVAAAVEAGKTIIEENGIEDPAPHLARDLLATGQQKYGIVPATIPPVKVDTGDVAQLAKAAHGADLLLDVQNLGVGWLYGAADWVHYRVSTSYKLRIVDVSRAALIGEGFCQQRQSQEEAKSKDELLADHAALLKQVIADQRDACRDAFEKQVLSIAH
jgi:hypothetical protein